MWSVLDVNDRFVILIVSQYVGVYEDFYEIPFLEDKLRSAFDSPVGTLHSEREAVSNLPVVAKFVHCLLIGIWQGDGVNGMRS